MNYKEQEYRNTLRLFMLSLLPSILLIVFVQIGLRLPKEKIDINNTQELNTILEDKEMVGVKPLNNFGGIVITSLTEEGLEYIYDYGDSKSEVYTANLTYDDLGEPYFETNEGKQYLKDFMKV